MEYHFNHRCDCAGEGPARPRMISLDLFCPDVAWVEKISLAELHETRDPDHLLGDPFAIRSRRAAVRGECGECGRLLPARSTVPGMVARRHRDAAGRVVTELSGEPRAWMRRFAGPRRRLHFACTIVDG